MNKDTKGFNKNPRKITYLASKDPHAQNPVYQISGRFGCPYCKSDKVKGRYKIFSNLWCLHCHFTREHTKENFRELSMSLAVLFMRGVLV